MSDGRVWPSHTVRVVCVWCGVHVLLARKDVWVAVRASFSLICQVPLQFNNFCLPKIGYYCYIILYIYLYYIVS
jgi:hypothetical protein